MPTTVSVKILAISDMPNCRLTVKGRGNGRFGGRLICFCKPQSTAYTSPEEVCCSKFTGEMLKNWKRTYKNSNIPNLRAARSSGQRPIYANWSRKLLPAANKELRLQIGSLRTRSRQILNSSIHTRWYRREQIELYNGVQSFKIKDLFT